MTDITRLRICLCLVVMAVMPVAATGYELHYDANGLALNDVCGLTAGNDAVFWAVGDSGRVLKVVNGDTSAQYNLGKGQFDLLSVSFADAKHGWVVGSKRDDPERGRGVVFSTATGGGGSKAWLASCPVIRPGVIVPFLKVLAMDVRHVWVTCGSGYMLYTNDGGEGWLVTVKRNRTDAEGSDHEK